MFLLLLNCLLKNLRVCKLCVCENFSTNTLSTSNSLRSFYDTPFGITCYGSVHRTSQVPGFSDTVCPRFPPDKMYLLYFCWFYTYNIFIVLIF